MMDTKIDFEVEPFPPDEMPPDYPFPSEDSLVPPPPDMPADFWVERREATKEKSSPRMSQSQSSLSAPLKSVRESSLDFSMLLSPAVLTKELDGNVVAQWLDGFFRDVYGQPPEHWVKTIKDTLLFPLAKRPLIAKAFLYGHRTPNQSPKLQKQEWFRWVLPLFEYSVAVQYSDDEFSEEKFTDALSVRAKNEYDSTGIVMVVQLLHWAFQNETVVAFSHLLAEIKDKFETLGWTEECSLRVTTIYKAFISKVKVCHSARMRADADLPWWDNLICFIASIEDHVFYSPTYGFAPKPEEEIIGIHIANQGCCDHELLADARDMLETLRADGAASVSVTNDKSYQKAQRKVNSKRQDALRSCTQLLDAACNYSAVLSDSLKLSASFENIDVQKLLTSVHELVEVLSKRTRFAKSSKKQAIAALEGAIHQKPVAMLDPWTDVKVLSSETPELKYVQLAERWHEQRAVVYLLRRFGCPLCLHQAAMLMALKPALDEHGVRLIAIGNGDYHLAKQFKEGLNWPGEVYLDPECTSYKAIHLKRLTNWEVAKRYFTSLRVLSWFKNNPHKASNQDGDGFQTGGVFIVGPGENSSVIFSFKEIDNDPLSFPIPEAIVNACAVDLKKYQRVIAHEPSHSRPSQSRPSQSRPSQSRPSQSRPSVTHIARDID